MTAPEDEPTVKANADQKAAHVFLSELRTRIATQPLLFGKGDAQGALNSLVQLFDFARQTMADHFGCTQFVALILPVLNTIVRDFTSRWHRKSLAGELRTRDGCVTFWTELREVQSELRHLANDLHQLAYGEPMAVHVDAESEEPQPVRGKLAFGIPASGLIDPEEAQAINDAEACEIRNRRGLDESDVVHDACGLALSGGGIRSASFCLGVAQVLAQRGLLADFDLISSVSGGGYTGAFLTRRLAAGTEADVASPDGPDTPAIKHLRRRAAFLHTGTLRQSLSIVMNLIAGMILNWTAPAAAIAVVVSLLLFLINPAIAGVWSHGHLVALATAVLTLLVYAWMPRHWSGLRTWLLRILWVFAVVSLAGFLLAWGYRPFESWIEGRVGVASISVGALIAALPLLSRLIPAAGKVWLRMVGNALVLAVAALSLPVLAIALAYLLYWLGGQDLELLAFLPALPGHENGASLLLLVTLIVGVTAWGALDINETGPHGFYRDRLKSTFVELTQGELGRHTDIDLVKLDPDGKAPYLLINAVANLPNSSAIELRERKGDFFLFSKHWTGSPVLHYRQTGGWRLRHRPVGLASAIAASGATVAPHMALMSIAAARALLSFVNLRLGLWIRRPDANGLGSGGRPGARELFREMLGWGMSEGNDWVLLTDGAHLDNTGVYELLRRRCRFIVAVDASADPDGDFSSLITLVRHARIDLGIEIRTDLDELRPDPETGLAPAHGAMCEIVYPEHSLAGSPTSLMLVIKLSMTGNESELIEAYRRRFPRFPNQPTSDQFFDEHQFEAYRRLGAHSAESLFHETLAGPGRGPKSAAEWLEHLYGIIPPGREVQ